MSSKLGAHALTSNDSVRQLLRSGSKIVKLVSDYQIAREISDPSAIIIGREYTEKTASQLLERGLTPKDAAYEFIYETRNGNGKSQLDIYQANPNIRLWEGANEPVWVTREQMEWYAQFEIARMSILADYGLRAVIGSFSTGSPPDELIPYFIPAIQEAIKRNGVLGLHEYGGVWIFWMTGTWQMQYRPDGSPKNWNEYNKDMGVGNGEGWTTLRYRRLVNKFLKPAGCGDVKIAITEFGLDRVAPTPPDFPSGHWRDMMNNNWGRHDGIGDPIDYWRGAEKNPERYYAEQMIWYDKQLQLDPNVLGATIFTVGSYGGSEWHNYDISNTSVINCLCDYINQERNVMNPQPSTNVETPHIPEIIPVEIPSVVKTRAWGVDTSGWKVDYNNQPPKWDIVKQEGASFVIGKCTDFDVDYNVPFVDRIWKDTEIRVRASGVILGAFAYWQPKGNPVAQAKAFRDAFDYKIGVDIMPVADVEESNGIESDSALENLVVFMLEIEKLFGVLPIIYTGLDYWKQLEKRFKTVKGRAILSKYNLDQDWAKRYYLWMSLPTENSQVPNPALVPDTWMKGATPEWVFWQTSWTGRVRGIQDDSNGEVDMNYFNGTKDELLEWVKSAHKNVDLPVEEQPVEEPPTVSPWLEVGKLFAQGKIGEAIEAIKRLGIYNV